MIGYILGRVYKLGMSILIGLFIDLSGEDDLPKCFTVSLTGLVYYGVCLCIPVFRSAIIFLYNDFACFQPAYY